MSHGGRHAVTPGIDKRALAELSMRRELRALSDAA
jgi:hypothetical protein